MTKVTEKDVRELKAFFSDPGRVLFGDEIAREYSHDELSFVRVMPEAVCKCKNAAEISAVLKFANEKKIPVTPRGAGTGLVGAAVPVEKGIVLDLAGMDRILELDEDNMTVTTEPGVLLQDLAAFCQDHGFFYPPDPGEKTATIGGNISTNAGGMRAVKYGVTRDYVRGLEVVLPTGEIVNFGGKTVKSSSGYDLKDLIIGAEGTLGVITKAILKILPLPKFDISLLVPFSDLERAIGAVPAIVRSESEPTAVEFMQGKVIRDAENYLGVRFPATGKDAFLLLKFDGMTREEVDRKYEFAAQLCLENGADDVYLLNTEERNESVWKPRGAFLEAIKNSTTEMDEVDVAVPKSEIYKMVQAVEEISATCGARLKYFGHAGDGNLHIYILRDDLPDEGWRKACDNAMDRMYEKAFELGGKVSGEHGIGLVKKPYLKRSLSPEELALMQGVKKTFDPNNILNPGKICQ